MKNMATLRYLPLICLALMHTVVDTSALLIEPLWPLLERSFALTGVAALSIALILQSLPTSLSQAVFGYLRDARKTPGILWIGPLLAVICLTTMGLAESRAVLCVLIVLGGIGVGAFHPEAAVAAGQAFPGQRTRGLSLFMFGGSLGLGLGPLLSGAIVDRWGLPGLSYAALPMAVCVVLLWKIGRLGALVGSMPVPHGHAGFGGALERRWGTALAVLLVCSLRLVPNMAMAKVISFEMSRRHYGTFAIGQTQSLFLVAASVGMFVMAFRFRSGWERAFMIYCPLAGIPLLLILGMHDCPLWLFIATLIPTGLILWGTSPAMVSYAQQLFPRGAGLASAITMGLSWGLGGLIQAPFTAHFQKMGAPYQAFHAFIPCLLLAAVGAWLLPRVQTEAESSSPQPIQPEVAPVQAEFGDR